MPIFRGSPGTGLPGGPQVLSLFGIPIFIEFGFLIFLGLFAMLFTGGEMDLPRMGLICAIIFFSLLVHEFGHALTARALGCDAIRIVLVFFGGYATHTPTTHGRSLLISLAGPAAEIVLALAGIVLILQPAVLSIGPPGAMEDMLGLIILLNLIWAGFNLIPIYPLDGGHVLFHGLALRLSPQKSMKITSWISMILCIVVGGLSYQRGFNFVALYCFFFFMQNYSLSRESAS